MLIKELIVRHVGSQGALHERGIRLNRAEVPPGVRVHQDGDDAVAPVAGDLLLIRAPVGLGLREHVDTDLAVGVTVVLLLAVEVTELPVGRVLAALAAAKLQVVEASVVTGMPAATVAVVATRTDELLAPQPYLAHDLEPGDNESLAVLRRVLGEHALEGLVQRARERVLALRLAVVTTELEQSRADRQDSRADRQDHVAMVRDRDTARREADTERKRMWALVQDLDTARGEAEAARERIRSLRSSRTFKLASRLARASGVARRIIRRSDHGKARG